MSPVLGLLLAAGAGRRMGAPKALLRDDRGEPFVRRSVAALREGGCDDVIVVLGAESDRAAALLDEGVSVVVADDWAEGMGASFRAGLAAAALTEASCALVSLVDLPDVGPAVVRRVVDQAGCGPGVLARAAYDGVPGHPVLIGRDHWSGVTATARGDRGARDYLAAHPPRLLECGDLATGQDVDTPDHLRQGLHRR
jgi:CTP:molybdopterin cytidylyltransferase MocA